MSFHISAVTLAAVSVLSDLKWGRIPNLWILCGWLGGFALQISRAGPAGILYFLQGAGLPFLLLGLLFFFRMLGGGDLKLLSALGGMMGASSVLYCLFWAFLFGALQSVLLMSCRHLWRQRFHYFFQYIRAYIKSGKRLPYRSPSFGAESLHFSLPVLMSVLLWTGGLY